MRDRRTSCAIGTLLAVAAALVSAGPAGAITPVNGGGAGGTATTVNDGRGDQTEPRVSGDLAVYTERADLFAPGVIRYVDFQTGSSGAVPAGASGDSDVLADVDGERIVFSRTRSSDGATAVMLFDLATGAVTELNPSGPGMMRFGAVVAGDTVAFSEFAAANGDIHVHDLVAATTTNVSQSPDLEAAPAVSPGGDLVVWERCVGSNCDIYGSSRGGGTWSTPAAVAATAANESNPDTDGTTIVYDSARPSAADQDVYLRPLAGGPEAALELPGLQRNPAISTGVVTFESKAAGGAPADLFAYVIATNTLYRVTDTPTRDESLNDVTVLPNGDVRVVWAADDDVGFGLHNIYARTFTVPLTADSDPPVLVLPPDRTVDATSPAGTVATYTASATDAVDPSPTLTCAPASGSLFAIGTTTVACTATDAAGNTATGSFTVAVRGAKEQLAHLVHEVLAAAAIPAPLKARLLARIQPLLATFDPGDRAQRRVVCAVLNAFVTSLRIFSGNGVPPALAAAWVADAVRIRAVLDC